MNSETNENKPWDNILLRNAFTVSLKADFTKLIVTVKQVGVNSSGINGIRWNIVLLFEISIKNSTSPIIELLLWYAQCKQILGFALKHDQLYELRTGDVLEILLGKYFYEIVFETDVTEDQKSDSPVTAVKDTWESVDDGKLLIFTPKDVKASNKVVV